MRRFFSIRSEETSGVWKVPQKLYQSEKTVWKKAFSQGGGVCHGISPRKIVSSGFMDGSEILKVLSTS